MTLDGTTISLSPAGEEFPDVLVKRYETESMEWVIVIASPELLNRVARAREARVTIDSMSFRLAGEQMKALRLLTALMNNVKDAG